VHKTIIQGEILKLRQSNLCRCNNDNSIFAQLLFLTAFAADVELLAYRIQ